VILYFSFPPSLPSHPPSLLTSSHPPPFPFPPLSYPFPSLLALLSPPLHLEVGLLKPARGSGERCKLPSWVCGGAPAENVFESKNTPFHQFLPTPVLKRCPCGLAVVRSGFRDSGINSSCCRRTDLRDGC